MIPVAQDKQPLQFGVFLSSVTPIRQEPRTPSINDASQKSAYVNVECPRRRD